MSDHDRFREEDLTPEQREKLNKLLDALMEVISSQPGDGADDGASVRLRLVPNEPEKDDPRIIEAIQAAAKLVDAKTPEDQEGDELTIEYGPNLIAPDATERDITNKVQEAVGPILEGQRAAEDAWRKQTGNRSRSVEDRSQARQDLQEAKRGITLFLNAMLNLSGDLLREGSRWWEEELRSPYKEMLAAVVVGQALGFAPTMTMLCTVCILAVSTRKRRDINATTDVEEFEDSSSAGE